MRKRLAKQTLVKLDGILGKHRPETKIQHDNVNAYHNCGFQPSPEPGSQNDVNSMASGPLELQTPEQMLNGPEVGEQRAMIDQIVRTFGGTGVKKVVFADENGHTHVEIDCRPERTQRVGVLPDNIYEYIKRNPPGGG